VEGVMLTRRRFLVGTIAVAVAPTAAPEVADAVSIWDGEWDKFHWGTSSSMTSKPITVETLREMAALLKENQVRPIMHKGVPCYRFEISKTFGFVRMDS
jgi:hypothetical protein